MIWVTDHRQLNLQVVSRQDEEIWNWKRMIDTVSRYVHIYNLPRHFTLHLIHTDIDWFSHNTNVMILNTSLRKGHVPKRAQLGVVFSARFDQM